MIDWENIVVGSKYAYGTDGHIPASELAGRIAHYPETEGYYNAFDFEKCDDTKGYVGKTRPALGLVNFDLDGPGALEDTRALVTWLGVPVVVFFSGSKGFHIGVPEYHFGLTHDETCHRRLGDLACHLKETYASLDTAVYNAARKFRIPGSRHSTGLFKTALTMAELALPLEDIKALARAQRKWVFNAAGPGAPLAKLTALLNLQKDKVYRVAKLSEADQGIIGAFKSHEKKLCITRLEKEEAPRGSLQNIAMILCTDYRNRRMPKAEALKKITAWCQLNGITDGRPESTLDDIYSGGDPYGYGCENEYKASRCSGRCAIYGKLSKDVRPVVVDAPLRLQKSESPSEVEIAKLMFQELGDTLVREDRSVFQYHEGVWRELGSVQIDKIKVGIMKLYNDAADSGVVDSTYKTLFRMLPAVPRGHTLFTPRTDCINFLNGTLKLIENDDNTLRKVWCTHDPMDFLINKLPLNYQENVKGVHPDVEKIFETVFGHDPDKAEKIRAIKQMFGFVLAPRFPHIFMLYGPPGSGKSTLIKMAQALVGEENQSSVAPSEMGQRFGLWPMVGKLANIVLDIPVDRVIADARIKMIKDHPMIDIERKGISGVRGQIPAAHIWGGNAIPPTNEDSGAHDSRWTFIKMTASLRTGTEDVKFAEHVVKTHLRSILNLAMEGLDDLIGARGHFIQPESGRQAMELFKEGGENPVQDFLRAIKEGEIVDGTSTLMLDDTKRIARSVLFTKYEGYATTRHVPRQFWSSKYLFKTLRAIGYTESKSPLTRYFNGIGTGGMADRDATEAHAY